jgi:hypothetical protein
MCGPQMRVLASEELNLVGRLRRGDRNCRYGTRDRPANPLDLVADTERSMTSPR